MSQSGKISKFGQKFISYGSYHYDEVNKWIHIICVPLIAATLLSLISFIPLTYEVSGHIITLAQLGYLSTMIYYFTINPLFGAGMTVLSAAIAYLWKLSFSGLDNSTLFKWVIAVHVVSWIFQFIGHGLFQKRKPALLDNFGQILIAPLFVVVEILEIVGIKTDEMEQWKTQVKKNVEEFRKNRSKVQ